MDICKLLDTSSSSRSYQILPGIYLTKDNLTYPAEEASIDLVRQAVINNQTDLLDIYVRKKLNAFLDSLSITLKIMDRNSAVNVRKFSDDLLTQLIPKWDIGMTF